MQKFGNLHERSCALDRVSRKAQVQRENIVTIVILAHLRRLILRNRVATQRYKKAQKKGFLNGV